MVTSKGRVIVDWDTVLVAAPERDLWRLAQGGGSALRAYADAAGRAPNERLVDLYGIRWDLAEIAAVVAEFRKPHEDSEDSRKAPGNPPFRCRAVASVGIDSQSGSQSPSPLVPIRERRV